jgi:hypothetical protein
MNFRTALALAVLLFASVAEAAGVPPPGCVGTLRTKSWTQADDPDFNVNAGAGSSIAFTITVPCYVTFDTDYIITAQVRDTRCTAANYAAHPAAFAPPPYIVGNHWNITDTPDATPLSTIAGAGLNGVSGFAPIKLRSDGAFDGTWLTTVKQHYGPAGTPVNHLIGFTFIPRDPNGCFVGAMGWQPQWVATTVIDPYPDATVVDPLLPGGATASAESGGCGSSGVTPAFLGLAALVAAGWPRRRRGR